MFKLTFIDDLTGNRASVTIQDKWDILTHSSMTEAQRFQFIKAIRWFEGERLKPVNVNFNDGSLLEVV